MTAAIYSWPESAILTFLRDEDLTITKRGQPHHFVSEEYLAARIAYLLSHRTEPTT